MLQSVEQLGQLLEFYAQTEGEVQLSLQLFQKNYVALTGDTLCQPDFELKFAKELTKQAYLQITQKLFACVRH